MIFIQGYTFSFNDRGNYSMMNWYKQYHEILEKVNPTQRLIIIESQDLIRLWEFQKRAHLTRKTTNAALCCLGLRFTNSMYCVFSYYIETLQKKQSARLAQSVEHETLNLRVVGSSPTLGDIPFHGNPQCLYIIFSILPQTYQISKLSRVL